IKLLLSKTELSLDTLDAILDLTLKVANTNSQTSKQRLEEELLRAIGSLSYHLWREEGVLLKRTGGTLNGDVANKLVKFAQEIYQIKISREAFAGKRRAYAVEIIGRLALRFSDVPEFFEMAKQSLKSKSKPEFLGAIEALEMYCEEREESIDDEIIKILDKRILKTKHRSEAVGALNLQIKAGVIDEFDALSEIDKWKEKNYN
ncbi:MAG: hypothetical protein ACPG49_04045, partial [Chitinophagales bacterium]